MDTHTYICKTIILIEETVNLRECGVKGVVRRGRGKGGNDVMQCTHA